MTLYSLGSYNTLKSIFQHGAMRRLKHLKYRCVWKSRKARMRNMILSRSQIEIATIYQLLMTQKRLRKPRGNNQILSGGAWNDLCNPLNNRSFGDPRCTANHERFMLYMRVTKPHFDEIITKCVRKYPDMTREAIERKVAVVFRYLASNDDLNRHSCLLLHLLNS